MKLKSGLFLTVFACLLGSSSASASVVENQEGYLPPFTKGPSIEVLPKVLKGNSGINYSPEEQEKILQLQRVYESLGNDQLPRSKYLEVPLVGSSGYSLGLLNQETIENATKNLNYYRKIAGVAGVDSLEKYDKFSQYASVGMAATGDQSHGLVNSTQPENMSTDFWNKSVQYTKDSVLHSAYQERSFGDHILAYLFDYGNGNRQVGHRAWLLSHQMSQIGYGYAPVENPISKTSVNYYTAMYIRDNLNTTTPEDKVVAWPSEGVFPTNLMVNSDVPLASLRWSAHFNSKGYNVTDDTTVTLTNTQTNQTWFFSKNTADGDYLINPKSVGYYRTLMFQPGTSEKPFNYKVGDLYSVKIEGLTGVSTSYEYQVRLFDVTEKLDEVPVSNIELTADKTKLNVGETVSVQASVLPNHATDKTLNWSSSNETVATVDQDGVVTTLSNGEVTISATSLSGNVTNSITLNIETVKAEQVYFLLSNYSNIPVGGTVQINGYINKPFNASNKAVIYQVSDKDKGKIEVSDTGLVTGTTRGIYTIKILSADGAAKNSVDIKVGSGYWIPDNFYFPIYLGDDPITPISVTGIQLNEHELSGSIGSVWKLKSTILPQEATNQYHRYRSSNPNVVEVLNTDKGELIAKQKGTAIITVFTADGLYEDTCIVTVN